MSFLEKLKKGTKIKMVRGAKKPKTEIKIKEEKWFETEGELAVDVYQTEKEIIVEVPVAGVKAEDLDIEIENDTIKIKGRREKLQEIEEEKYLIRECYWGPFSREIILPMEVDGSKAEASMEEGILVIEMPKIEPKETKKIKIKKQ